MPISINRMPNSIYQLVYLSFANFDIGDKDVVSDILKSSTLNNSRLNVTGILFYKDGTFIQLIEGAKEVIKNLYKKISLDSRHEHLQIFWEGNSSQRSFPNWSMSLKDINELDSELQEEFKEILNLKNDQSKKEAGYKFFEKLKERI